MMIIKKILPLFLLFILLRLIFIFNFPPFCDESIHVNTAQVMMSYPDMQWLSISVQTKPPLIFWFFGIGSFLFRDPIIGARLIALLLSVPSFFILFYWVKGMVNEKTAKIALLILTLCPLFILFQSTVLMEGLIITVTLAIFWLLFLIKEKEDWQKFIILGILFGVTFWIKLSALLATFLAYILLICIIFNKKISLKRKIVLLFIPMIIFLLFVLFLAIRPDFRYLFSEYNRYTVSGNDLTAFSTNLWMNNFFYIFLTLLIYLAPTTLFGIIFAVKKINNKLLFLLLLGSILLLLSAIFTIKVMRVRYFLPGIIPLVPVFAIGANEIIQKWKKYQINVSILFFTPLVILSLILVISPTTFFSFFPKDSIVKSERDYAFSWPSGYGMKEAINFIEKNKLYNSQMLLIVPSASGNPGDYFSAYYRFDPLVKVVMSPVSSKEDFENINKAFKPAPLYLLTRGSFITKEIEPFIRKIMIFNKPNNEDFLGLYEIHF